MERINPQKIELNETYFEKSNVKTNTAMDISAASGNTASIKPKSVATPLPPLKPT